MGWRFFHDFLKWVGISFFPGLVAVATLGLGVGAVFPESKPWLAQRFQEAVAVMGTVGFWLIVAAVLLVWSFLWVWSGRKAVVGEKPDLATLAELLRPMLQLPGAPEQGLEAEPTIYHLEAQDVVTGQPEITPAEITVHPPVLRNKQTFPSPTVTQRSHEFPPGLYVGLIIIAAGRLGDEHSLEIAIRAFNGTDTALRLAGIGGEIEAGETTKLPQKLPPAECVREHTPEPIPPHQEFVVVLRQPVPEATAREFLEVIEKGSYVSLDLRAFNIEMAVADNANLRARLPLWDGAAIMRRDDLFTARIVMATFSATARAEASLNMVLTRADGTAEDRNA